MKVVFFRKSVGFFLWMLLYWFFVAGGILAMIVLVIEQETGAIKIGDVIKFIICLVGTIRFALESIGLICCHITFLDDVMMISGERWVQDKVQFKDQVFYKDISKVTLIYSNKNSKKQSIKTIPTQAAHRRLFFEFLLKNGRKKWMAIYCFSKKQKRQMTQLISQKTDLNISFDELYEQLKQSDKEKYRRKRTN